MYYARYDLVCSDIAVFETEAERDAWIAKPGFFDKVPLSNDDVEIFTDIHSEPVDDPVDDVKWLICYINM